MAIWGLVRAGEVVVEAEAEAEGGMELSGWGRVGRRKTQPSSASKILN